MHLTPTRSLYTKAWMTFASITVFVATGAGLTTLIINVASEDPGAAIPVVWIVVGSRCRDGRPEVHGDARARNRSALQPLGAARQHRDQPGHGRGHDR